MDGRDGVLFRSQILRQRTESLRVARSSSQVVDLGLGGCKGLAGPILLKVVHELDGAPGDRKAVEQLGHQAVLPKLTHPNLAPRPSAR